MRSITKKFAAVLTAFHIEHHQLMRRPSQPATLHLHLRHNLLALYDRLASLGYAESAQRPRLEHSSQASLLLYSERFNEELLNGLRSKSIEEFPQLPFLYKTYRKAHEQALRNYTSYRAAAEQLMAEQERHTFVIRPVLPPLQSALWNRPQRLPSAAPPDEVTPQNPLNIYNAAPLAPSAHAFAVYFIPKTLQ